MDLIEVFGAKKDRFGLGFAGFEIPQHQKVVKRVDVRILNLFYPFVFCFFLKLKQNGFSFQQTLQIIDLPAALNSLFTLFRRQLIGNRHVLIHAIKVIRQQHGPTGIHFGKGGF
jgi:hypothetical protein